MINSRLVREELKEGTNSWRSSWRNSTKNGMDGLENGYFS